MPVRMCVGCQEMKNKKEMIRVIRTSGLERSFKQAIPAEVYESLEKEMEALETR